MNPEYVVGQFVFSKSGRDKGILFIVVHIDGEYLYLADGKLRKVETPKKKKMKHVQKTNYVNKLIKEEILNGTVPSDSYIRKSLKQYWETSSY